MTANDTSKRLAPGENGKVSGFHQLPSGKWQVRRRIGMCDGTVEVSGTGRTQTEARRRLNAKVEARISADKVRSGRYEYDTTLDVLFDRLMDDKQRSGKITRQSMVTYSITINNHLKPHFGTLTIAEATEARLDDLVRAWEDSTGRDPQTLRFLLKQAMQIAVDFGPLKSNPTKDISRPPKRKRKEIVPATPEEFGLLRRTAVAYCARPKRTDQRLVAAIDIMAGTGMRIGEVLALRACDVEEINSRLIITVAGTIIRGGSRQDWTKGKEGLSRSARRLVAPRFLEPTLRRLIAAQSEKDGHLFVTSTGRPWAVPSFRKQFDECRTLAGLPLGFTSHRLRKMVATQIGDRFGARAAQRQMGHKTVKMTQSAYIARSQLSPRAAGSAGVLGDKIASVRASESMDEDEAA